MRRRLDPSLLDWEGELFEVDDGNRAHLFSHGYYSEQDLDDVLEHDSVLLEANLTKGDADWLLVGQPPRRTSLGRTAGPVEVRKRKASEAHRYLSGGWR